MIIWQSTLNGKIRNADCSKSFEDEQLLKPQELHPHRGMLVCLSSPPYLSVTDSDVRLSQFRQLLLLNSSSLPISFKS